MRAFMWVHDHGELTPPSEEDYKAVYTGPEEEWSEVFVERLIGNMPTHIASERDVRRLLANLVVAHNLQGDFDPHKPMGSYTKHNGMNLYHPDHAKRIDGLLIEAQLLVGIEQLYKLTESLMYEVYMFS